MPTYKERLDVPGIIRNVVKVTSCFHTRKKFCLQFGHSLSKTFASPLGCRKSLNNMGLKRCKIICLPRAPTGLGPTLPSLSCQNEHGLRGAEGPNRFSPETSASLLKSFSIKFSASVNLRRFRLLFLLLLLLHHHHQEQVFVDLQGAPYPA